MKTLSEYESERRNFRQETAWLGVACDHCGSELYNPMPGICFTTDPPKIAAKCSKCDFNGYLTR